MNYSNYIETILDEYGFYWIENMDKIHTKKRMCISNYYYYLFNNNCVTFNNIKNSDYFKQNIPFIPLDVNPNFKWKNICENRNLNWNYTQLCFHPNIAWKIIKDNPNLLCNKYNVSRNPNITWDIIRKNPQYGWYWEFIFSNRNISWENILEIIEKIKEIRKLNKSFISSNPNITCEIVKNNPTFEWDWYYLSFNENLTIEFVKENLDKNFSWYGISKHKNITWDIICKNPQFSWNWNGISENPNITWEIIKENLEKPWCWLELSQNSNITWDIILSNPDKPWRYDILHLNNFEMDKNNFIRKKLREWFKRSDLKEELIAKLWHPKNFEKFKYYDPDEFDEDEG